MTTIKQRRQALGISQAEAARRANLNAATWGAIENGHLRPYASQLRKMSLVFKISVDELARELEVSR